MGKSEDDMEFSMPEWAKNKKAETEVKDTSLTLSFSKEDESPSQPRKYKGETLDYQDKLLSKSLTTGDIKGSIKDQTFGPTVKSTRMSIMPVNSDYNKALDKYRNYSPPKLTNKAQDLLSKRDNYVGINKKGKEPKKIMEI